VNSPAPPRRSASTLRLVEGLRDRGRPWANIGLTCVRADGSPARDVGHGSPRLMPYGRPPAVRRHRFVEGRRKKCQGTTKREWWTSKRVPTVGRVLCPFALGCDPRGLRSRAAWTVWASVGCVLVVGSLTLDWGFRNLSRELARSTTANGHLHYVLSRDYVIEVGRGQTYVWRVCEPLARPRETWAKGALVSCRTAGPRRCGGTVLLRDDGKSVEGLRKECGQRASRCLP